MGFRGWRGPRRLLSDEEKARNAARKAAREAASMTCQCCGRKILANKGVIAHHGYERPGYGWQTQSCMGARFLPYEADRVRLGVLIDRLRDHKKHLEQAVLNLKEEVIPCTFNYQVWEKGQYGRYGAGKYVGKSAEVTRATFDEQWKDLSRYTNIRDFDTLKAKNVAELEGKISFVAADIKTSVSRFNAWKKTHKWNKEAETWDELTTITT